LVWELYRVIIWGEQHGLGDFQSIRQSRSGNRGQQGTG
jgi:hypothetical protein